MRQTQTNGSNLPAEVVGATETTTELSDHCKRVIAFVDRKDAEVDEKRKKVMDNLRDKPKNLSYEQKKELLRWFEIDPAVEEADGIKEIRTVIENDINYFEAINGFGKWEAN